MASNSLSVACVEDVCALLGALPSLQALDLGHNPLGAAKRLCRGWWMGRRPSKQSGFSMLRSLPSALRVGSKAKDLLIAVLTNATLCELYVDNGVLTEREATQLEQKLNRNREQRSVQMEYRSLGADAPPVLTVGQKPPTPLHRRVMSWGRQKAQPPAAPTETPVLGVLFSAPLACTDATGQVLPMEMLDFEKERLLINDSLSEAKRSVSVRYEHATTDRLRTLVTLKACVGLHYSGHGDPQFLSMEDGRGGAHFVPVTKLRKLLEAGGLSAGSGASLQVVFVSACFSEAAAEAFLQAGVPHVIAVRRTTRVSDLAAHAFTRAFYLALVVGSTIRAAYDIGVQAVVSAPNVPSSEREASNFLLLPADASHDAVVLPALPGVDAGNRRRRAPRLQQPLPLRAEAFLGRNVETYRVVSASWMGASSPSPAARGSASRPSPLPLSTT